MYHWVVGGPGERRRGRKVTVYHWVVGGPGWGTDIFKGVRPHYVELAVVCEIWGWLGRPLNSEKPLVVVRNPAPLEEEILNLI